ncbi:hypothetical protein FRC07_014628, partial [Ceratobasidium sp. 392]
MSLLSGAKIPKTNSSVHDIKEDAPPFGSRQAVNLANLSQAVDPTTNLQIPDRGDHVPPPPDQAVQIERALGRQRGSPVPKDAHGTYNDNPASFWDRFYKWNEGNFFRDRKWLHQEFPELTELTRSD